MTAKFVSLDITPALRLDALFAHREHKGQIRAVKPDPPGRTSGGIHNRVKEILRTNDAVLLSWARTVLTDAGIEAVVLDTHTSILEGSIAAIPQRLVVSDGDHAAAVRHLDAARDGLRDADPQPAPRPRRMRCSAAGCRFRQPAQGYRAAIDPVLLAAALPARVPRPRRRSRLRRRCRWLCLAARLPQVSVVGIERDPLLAELARQNVADNAFSARASRSSRPISAGCRRRSAASMR